MDSAYDGDSTSSSATLRELPLNTAASWQMDVLVLMKLRLYACLDQREEVRIVVDINRVTSAEIVPIDFGRRGGTTLRAAR
ncbi:hypothetical protein AXK61_06370 [Tsukamurella pseudospumae]|uniref:Uncharacterized protein n=1 Tax=Tsukamurella pseudospumae TaxID=239498 RepID=A0A137YZ06_9ACTN|nr:hypothetical protein AXK61_06370 [Tsukamurella pseudospumae]